MSGTSLRRRRGADYLSVRGNLPGDAGETLTWCVTVPGLAGGLALPTAAVPHLITLTRLQAVLPTTPARRT